MDLKSEIRVLSLFELFAEVGRAMPLTELAERMGIPASSCFNLVRGVEQRGYLYAAKARGALYPTRRLYDVAKSILDNDVVSPAIRARMAALRDQAGETVCLAQRRDKEVVYLEVHESHHSIRFTVGVGDTRDLHSNSMGKAILATLAAGDRERVLQRLSYRRHSPRTLVTPEALSADVERGRQRGWWSNEGESAPDALAIAVPVRIGSEWYGLSIVGPASRMSPMQDTLVKALRETAADVSSTAGA